jgi:GNAT superfamily N-acetyltransferase
MEPQGIKVFEEFATAEGMRLRDAAGWSTYVALEETGIVGVLHIKEGKHISMLFVLPLFQKRGIGRALVAAADKSERLETVHSSVNATNSYVSYGFKISGQEQVVDGIRFVPMQRKAR